ncbi:cation diffusion facilitator family transporter [Fusobacterium necrophorum]|uniref:Cation transporter n=1 Tax=Fusobacterium necrophorum subsp. funduliforme B35 TaxID=1226633 RepID=A0A017H798_9FUSO|nr:cation diffusion facilitator family transporter [Fusobacterium necrophorum]EYD70251.1 cation diffusion facilitator family transporter [Fusobacterium necrophorum subsp. funduliforme B35]KID49887.1 cation transporter [Fusobacterium necrophorum subsp. funduliforme B35]
MLKNYKEVQKVLLIILVLNILVAGVKTVLGYLIHSSSMLADGIHSFSDGASNVVGLLGIQLSKKPEDTQHPYGHEKIEMLSSLCIGLLLFFLGVQVFLEGIRSFQNPKVPVITTESMLLLAVTLLINIAVSYFEAKKGRQLKSTILVSDAMHTKSDIYVSFGVFFSLFAIKMGLPAYVDILMSCLVSFFILHAAWEILRDNVGILLDSKVLEEARIRKVILSHPEIKGVHKIRTRGTLAHVYMDLHILVEKDMTVEVAHKLSHSLEEELQKEFQVEIQVLIHVEPYREVCYLKK